MTEPNVNRRQPVRPTHPFSRRQLLAMGGAGLAAAGCESQQRDQTTNDRKPTVPVGPRRITRFEQEFVEIPAGSFVMGKYGVTLSDFIRRTSEDPAKELLRLKRRVQPHYVRITKSFYMATTKLRPISHHLAALALGDYLPYGPNFTGGDSSKGVPVVVSRWDETSKIAQQLSEADPLYDYALPTEAQWEYVARGEQRPDDPRKTEIFLDLPIQVGDSGGRVTCPGCREPNAFGVAEMLGGWGEVCSDWFDPDYYMNSPLDDPTGPPTGTHRVGRGPRSTAGRIPLIPDGGDNDHLSMRLVLTPKASAPT